MPGGRVCATSVSLFPNPFVGNIHTPSFSVSLCFSLALPRLLLLSLLYFLSSSLSTGKSSPFSLVFSSSVSCTFSFTMFPFLLPANLLS